MADSVAACVDADAPSGTGQSSGSSAADGLADLGIVFVHGIGSQPEGAALVQFGDPFVQFVKGWVEARHGNVVVEADAGSPASVSIVASLRGSMGRFVVTEGWWAEEFAAVPASSGVRFALTFAPRLLRRLLRRVLAVLMPGVALTDEGTRRSFVAGDVAGVAVLGFAFFALWALAVVAVVLFVAGVVVSTGVCVALLVGTVVPPVRSFAARAQATLDAATGDSWALVNSPVRAAQVVAAVDETLDRVATSCRRTMVVAHSQGAAILLRALELRPRPELLHVATVGSGIGVLEGGAQELADRLRAVLANHGGATWDDYYTALDLVPSGPLVPEPVEHLTSHRVANLASVVRDHSAYFANPEQVIAPIAVTAMAHAGLAGATEEELHQVADAGERRDARLVVLTLALIVVVLGGAAAGFTASEARWGGAFASPLGWLIAPLWEPAAEWLRNRSGPANTVTSFVSAAAAAAGLIGVLRAGFVASSRRSWQRLVGGGPPARVDRVPFVLAIVAATCLQAGFFLWADRTVAFSWWDDDADYVGEVALVGAVLVILSALASLVTPMSPWRTSPLQPPVDIAEVIPGLVGSDRSEPQPTALWIFDLFGSRRNPERGVDDVPHGGRGTSAPE